MGGRGKPLPLCSLIKLFPRFDCGHWFARSEEDGSIERFLTAHKVRLTLAKSGAMSALGEHTPTPPHTHPDTHTHPHLTLRVKCSYYI